jgi:hypothetical protein
MDDFGVLWLDVAVDSVDNAKLGEWMEEFAGNRADAGDVGEGVGGKSLSCWQLSSYVAYAKSVAA